LVVPIIIILVFFHRNDLSSILCKKSNGGKMCVVFLCHVRLRYSKKIKRTAYCTIVNIPLTYFLGQFQPLFLSIFSEYRLSDPVTFGIVYTLVFNLSKPVGGILFGIAFWSIAQKYWSQSSKGLPDYFCIWTCILTSRIRRNKPIYLC